MRGLRERSRPGAFAGLHRVLDLLLPARCPGCGGAVEMSADRLPVCAPCRAGMREPARPRCSRCGIPRGTGRDPEAPCRACASWPPVLVEARASAVLEPPASGLVHALKYGGQPDLAPVMAARMARLCPPGPALAAAMVTAVPTTSARRRGRGYDQAELLGRAYAHATGLPFRPLLRRVRGGPSQVDLAPERRRSNVAGAFRPLPALPGRRLPEGGAAPPVILVDDVLTTGATVAAAASALERAGAGGVHVLAFARALPDRTDG